MIWSACRIVLSRCAMVMQVRLRRSRNRASCIPASVFVSSAEVASSSRTMGGFLRRHLAMATRCFSPPDSLSPLSPTVVSHLSGRDSMKPLSCAISATRSHSSIVASSLPYLMLCSRVSLNMTVS
mmetsp:Transcript_33684/g.83357  ORF Transcript_33684/g.83357 Transcript_33684/m.83357 type:complete len:125 (-) Transcript_33684:1838-2212(-)